MGWTARNIPSFPFTLANPPDEITLENEVDGAVMRYVPERTCKVVRSYYDDLLDEDYTDLSCGHYARAAEREFSYCPKCGAKVVGE